MTTPVVADTGTQAEQSKKKRKWDSVEEEAASNAFSTKESESDVNTAETLVKRAEGVAKEPRVDLRAAIEAASKIKETLSAKGVDTASSGNGPVAGSSSIKTASLAETLGIEAEKVHGRLLISRG